MEAFCDSLAVDYGFAIGYDSDCYNENRLVHHDHFPNYYHLRCTFSCTRCDATDLGLFLPLRAVSYPNNRLMRHEPSSLRCQFLCAYRLVNLDLLFEQPPAACPFEVCLNEGSIHAVEPTPTFRGSRVANCRESLLLSLRAARNVRTERLVCAANSIVNGFNRLWHVIARGGKWKWLGDSTGTDCASGYRSAVSCPLAVSGLEDKRSISRPYLATV